ncbi:MAG: glycosyltransferase family 39 protein [Candidatus Obscuribacterales bacterium]
MLSREYQKWVIISFALASLGLLLSLNLFGVIDPSEGFYTEASREMLERREFLTPYLNFHTFFEKPIGIYWLIIGAYKLFGISEFAARLPSALAAIASALFTGYILSKLHLRRVGFFSALVLLTMPLFGIVGRLSLTDMPLTACLSSSLLSIFYYACTRANGHYLLLGYFLLALAVLIKGPIAIVLVVAIILLKQLIGAAVAPSAVLASNHSAALVKPPFADYFFKLFAGLSPFGVFSALAIIMAVNLPWYLYECVHTRGAFFQEFFVRQHFSRLQGALSHQEPWYFYLVVFAVGTLPWTSFLTGFVSPVRQLFGPATRIRSRLVRFSMVWIAVILTAFSLSSAKLATYIVPCAVPMSVLVAISMDYLIRLGKTSRILLSASIANFILLAAPVGAALLFRFRCDRNDLLVLALSLAIAPFVTFFAHRARRSAQVLTISVCGLSLGITASLAASLHCYDEVKNRSLRSLYRTVAAQNSSVGSFLRFAPGSLFYVRKPINSLSTVDDYLRFVRDTPAPHVLIAESSVSDLLPAVCPGLRKVKDEGEYSLLEVSTAPISVQSSQSEHIPK